MDTFCYPGTRELDARAVAEAYRRLDRWNREESLESNPLYL